MPLDYAKIRGHGGHDRMVVGFTTTYAVSAYIVHVSTLML